MHALKTDLICAFVEPTDTLATRAKSTLDRLAGHMAMAQILGDQLLYEVHGPFVPPQYQAARCPVIAGLIEALSSRLRGVALRIPMRRAAYSSDGLDDYMLRDIGVTRAEMEFAIGFIDRRA